MKMKNSLVLILLICLNFAAYSQVVNPQYGDVQNWVLTLNEDRIEKIKPYNYDSERPYSYAYSGRVSNDKATLRLLEGEEFLRLRIVLHAEDGQDAFFRFGVGGVDADGNYEIAKFYNVNNNRMYYTFFDFVELDAATNVIDFYYDDDAKEYQLRHNDAPVICGSLDIAGVKEMFVSADNGDNTNAQVYVSIEPEIDLLLPCDPACMEVNELTVGDVPQTFDTYPIPANEYVIVEFDSLLDENIHINLVDAAGKIAYRHSQEVRAGHVADIHLPTAHLPTGIYYVNIQSQQKFDPKKITIFR